MLSSQGCVVVSSDSSFEFGYKSFGGKELYLCHRLLICATNGGKLPWSDNTAMGQPPKHNAKSIGTGTSGHANGDLKTVKHCYIPPDIANPGNVIHCNVGGKRMGDALAHENEAPFAEYLAEFFIRSFCPEGGIVRRGDCLEFADKLVAQCGRCLGIKHRLCEIRDGF